MAKPTTGWTIGSTTYPQEQWKKLLEQFEIKQADWAKLQPSTWVSDSTRWGSYSIGTDTVKAFEQWQRQPDPWDRTQRMIDDYCKVPGVVWIKDWA